MKKVTNSKQTTALLFNSYYYDCYFYLFLYATGFEVYSGSSGGGGKGSKGNKGNKVSSKVSSKVNKVSTSSSSSSSSSSFAAHPLQLQPQLQPPQLPPTKKMKLGHVIQAEDM